MAFEIGTAILWAVGAPASVGALEVAGVSIATIVGTTAVIGATYGIQSATAPTFNSGPANQQFTTRQPVPARRRYYGKNKAGGYFAFIRTDSGNLYEVILIAAHEIEFLEHWIGDRLVTVDGSGDVTAPSTMLDDAIKRFHVYIKTGTDSQTAHSQLVSAFSSLWTSNHRLRGIANVLFKQDGVEAKKLSRFYPGGPQAYRAVFNGARVYDVNDGGQDPDDSTTWDLGHDNAANVIRDFLISPQGMRIPRSAVDGALADWQAAATICDQSVTLKDTTTDRRYRIAGGYNLDAPPKDTLAKLLAACDGQLFMKADGSLALKVGIWEAPTVTLDESHIRNFNLPRGLGPLRQANEIRASFTDPNQDYQPVEAEPWRDEADISSRGEVLSKTVDLSLVPTHNQARRLMKIAASRANPPRAGTITTDLYGLNALGERRVHVSIPRRNIDLDMDVTSFKIDMTSMSCVIGVSAVDSTAYDFDATTEEGTITIPADTGSGNSSVPAPSSPTGLTAVNASGTVTVHFTAPNDVNVYACRVWRGTSTFGAATDISGLIYCAPSQALSTTDAPGTGTWKYWVTAESSSGNASAETGPATVAV